MNAHNGEDTMIMLFMKTVRWVVMACAAIPLVCVAASQKVYHFGLTSSFLLLLAGCGVILVLAGWGSRRLLVRTRSSIEGLAERQTRLPEGLTPGLAKVAIVLSAMAGLFLELIVIRWQGSLFEFFSLYKNVGLLACFTGLGLGYSLATRRQIPVFFTLFLLFLQAGFLTFLKHGLTWRAGIFLTNPVKEQIAMGVATTGGVISYAAIYLFLVSIFLLTAMTFVPLGQLCGRFMRGMPVLKAYGWNLLGSLLGVMASFAVSAFWTPPAVWFAIAFLMILVFEYGDRVELGLGALCSLASVIVLTLPVSTGWEKIYSPYQLVERGPSQEGYRAGLTTLRVSGNYYQRILDLSPAAQGGAPESRKQAAYYELPYRMFQKPGRVAVLGAGTGNDVAAALRMGAGEVDAVEIDPVILKMGSLYHPEQPYRNPRVRPWVQDARTFIRNTDRKYDLIVYGLLDSHALLSHGSSVRLDSFVYTVEGFREARARLTEDGALCLSFCVVQPALGKKIYAMLAEAFDGRKPLCVKAAYDGSIIFVQGMHRNPDLPPEVSARAEFTDISRVLEQQADKVNVSTDDWPFFYMPRRVFPVTYVVLLCVLAVTATWLVGRFSGGKSLLAAPALFLMGAGFMLVETKGITELGLMYGNTWQVIGIMIAGVLVMAYAANVMVERVAVRRVEIPFALLIGSLLAGVIVMRYGMLGASWTGRVAFVFVLALPVLFSGVVFSCLLRDCGEVSGAMASNLLGSVLGGLLEYHSMALGFRSLYFIAIGIYVAAFLLRNRTAIRGSE